MWNKVHLGVCGLAAVFFLCLTLTNVEMRWSIGDILLIWACAALLPVVLFLCVLYQEKQMHYGWADILAVIWIVYIILRTWIGGEQSCGTEFLKMIEMAVLYIVLRSLFAGMRLSSLCLMTGILLCGVYEACEGIMQLLGGASRHSQYLLTGSFLNPGPYSAYLMMCCVIGVAWFQCSFPEKKMVRKSRYGKWCQYFIGSSLLLMLVLLPATWSRAAWVSAGTIALWLYRKKYWAHRWVVWLGIIVIAVSCYFLKQGSADGRILTWIASLTEWLHHPLWGVGIGGFRRACAEGIANLYHQMPQSALFHAGGVAEYAFNDFLKIIVEQGAVGALLCLGFVITSMLQLYRKSLPLFYGMLSLLIFSQFSYPFELLPYRILAALIFAYAASHKKGDKKITVWYSPVMILLAMMPIAYSLIKEIEKRHEADKESLLFSGLQHEAFINDYYELLPLEYDNPSFLFDFGKTLRNAKRHNDSNAVLRMGTKISSDPMFWVLMGNNFRDMKCYAEAETAYRKAFCIMPNRLYPLYQLMMMHEEKGDRSQVQSVAKQILKIQPKIPSPATVEMADSAKNKLVHNGK